MNALFIHDNKFWTYGDNVYSYGHFAYDLLWKRYLRYFDTILVGGRFYEGSESECANMSVSNGENVAFFPLPDLASIKGLLKVGEARKLIREKMQEVDFVIIRLFSMLGYIACEEAKRLHKPYAVEVVGCAKDAYMNHSRKGKYIAPIMVFLEKKYVKQAPSALYVSRHFLQKRYPNNHFSIGCPDSNVRLVNAIVLKNRIDKIDAIDKKSEIRIGLIASLNVDYKGHDTAIRAVSLIKDKYPQVRLCFLGDGDKTKWKRLAEQYGVANHVEFCGALPGGNPVFQWIDSIDIFIMPSLQETLGRALIEAMSRGCPAIGGAGTAVPEQLPDDCIHERKNHKQLASMIEYMIDHPEYMKLCAEENYIRAKKYSEEILQARRDYFWNTVTGNCK